MILHTLDNMLSCFIILYLSIFADFVSFIAYLCLDQHTTPYKHKLNHT